MKTTTLMLFCFVAACDTRGDLPEAQAALTDNNGLIRHILATTGHDADEQLTPGKSLPVYLVRLDELAVFDTKVEPLLHDLHQRIVPLHGRAGAARTSMTMALEGGRWVMARAGAENLTRAVSAARAAVPGNELGLVRIPGLHLDLLASHDGGLTLTPLFDDPELGLKALGSRPAAALFAELAPAAKKVLAEEGR
jgi:hypothetical protein